MGCCCCITARMSRTKAARLHLVRSDTYMTDYIRAGRRRLGNALRIRGAIITQVIRAGEYDYRVLLSRDSQQLQQIRLEFSRSAPSVPVAHSSGPNISEMPSMHWYADHAGLCSLRDKDPWLPYAIHRIDDSSFCLHDTSRLESCGVDPQFSKEQVERGYRIMQGALLKRTTQPVNMSPSFQTDPWGREGSFRVKN